MSLYLAPSQIRFMQDTIYPYFYGRKHVNGTIDDICCGRESVNNIPDIRVTQRDDKYYSLDNRRLYLFRVLEKRGRLSRIKVSLVTSWETKKFTTKDDGASIEVRGDTTYPHTFDQLRPRTDDEENVETSSNNEREITDESSSSIAADTSHDSLSRNQSQEEEVVKNVEATDVVAENRSDSDKQDASCREAQDKNDFNQCYVLVQHLVQKVIEVTQSVGAENDLRAAEEAAAMNHLSLCNVDDPMCDANDITSLEYEDHDDVKLDVKVGQKHDEVRSKQTDEEKTFGEPNNDLQRKQLSLNLISESERLKPFGSNGKEVAENSAEINDMLEEHGNTSSANKVEEDQELSSNEDTKHTSSARELGLGQKRVWHFDEPDINNCSAKLQKMEKDQTPSQEGNLETSV